MRGGYERWRVGSCGTLLLLAAASSCSVEPTAGVEQTSSASSRLIRSSPPRLATRDALANAARAGGGENRLAGGPFAVGRRYVKERVATITPDVGLVLPHWTSSFVSDGTTFPYAIVGADPALGQTTTIPTVVIPYRLVFADGSVLDASSDLIDGRTPLDGIMESPIFQPAAFSVGSTSLGVTQWGDAILRANFWDRRPRGDGYHVLLAPTVLPTVTINVPAKDGLTAVNAGSGRHVGEIDFQWAQNLFVNETASLGVTPDKLAIHVFSEVFLTTLAGLRAGGYHFADDLSGLTGISGRQTYLETGYFGAATTFSDGRPDPTATGTGVVAHEVAEWLNDPNVQNYVPGWQVPGQPHRCYSGALEVGDPLEGQDVQLRIPLNGSVYNFPDVAFLSYFSRANKSQSVNGWRTLLNTFTTPSIPCSYTPFYDWELNFVGGGGAPITTVLTGLNNTGAAVGYVMDNGFPVGIELAGYDPVHFIGGVASTVAVPVPGRPGYVFATLPSAVDDAGNVVGYFTDFVGTHGFIESNGQYRTIDVPGSIATFLLGTNNRPHPDLVGQYFDASSVSHGFVLHKGTFTTIDTPFGVNTAVNGINDHRHIVGGYDSGGLSGGFEADLPDADDECRASRFVAVNYPQYSAATLVSTQLTGVNKAGEIVGAVTLTSAGYSVTWALDDVDGNFQALGGGVNANDAFATIPNAISENGNIVGFTSDTFGTQAMSWVRFTLVQASSSSPGATATLSLPPNPGTIVP